jgi:hypothetical protein
VLFARNDVYNLASTTLAELNASVSKSKQSVVLANAHVLAGVCLCATLANDDGSGRNDGAIENLYAEALCI